MNFGTKTGVYVLNKSSLEEETNERLSALTFDERGKTGDCRPQIQA